MKQFEPQRLDRGAGGRPFRAQHKDVLAPVMASMTSPRSEIDKETLQRSCKEHLEQLGLLQERYRLDSKTKLSEFDRISGRPKTQGYELTRLDTLLLWQVGFQDPHAAGR